MAAPPTVPSNSPGPSCPIRGSKKRHRPTALSFSSTTSIARPPLYDSPPNTPTYGQSRGVSESLPASPLAPYQPTILTPFPPRRPPRMGLVAPEPRPGDSGADNSIPTPLSPVQKNMSEAIGASPRSAIGTRSNGPPTPTTESAESSAKNSVASSPNLSGSSRRPNYTRWTPAEDNLLRASIAIHGTSKWSAVAAMVPGRAPMQCSTRWSGALNATIHKGRWEKDEDEILVKAVEEWKRYRLNHGQSASSGIGSSSQRKPSTKGKDADDEEGDEEKEANDPMKAIPWSDIALLLPRKRTGIQCQARWSEALDPTVRKGKWSSGRTPLSSMESRDTVQPGSKCKLSFPTGRRDNAGRAGCKSRIARRTCVRRIRHIKRKRKYLNGF
ncbi:myb-like DNA-binding protein bas1 [Saitoella coloradoensis]